MSAAQASPAKRPRADEPASTASKLVTIRSETRDYLVDPGAIPDGSMLAAALSEGWKEAATGIIDMRHRDPELIGLVVAFLRGRSVSDALPTATLRDLAGEAAYLGLDALEVAAQSVMLSHASPSTNLPRPRVEFVEDEEYPPPADGEEAQGNTLYCVKLRDVAIEIEMHGAPGTQMNGYTPTRLKLKLSDAHEDMLRDLLGATGFLKVAGVLMYSSVPSGPSPPDCFDPAGVGFSIANGDGKVVTVTQVQVWAFLYWCACGVERDGGPDIGPLRQLFAANRNRDPDNWHDPSFGNWSHAMHADSIVVRLFRLGAPTDEPGSAAVQPKDGRLMARKIPTPGLVVFDSIVAVRACVPICHALRAVAD